MEVRAKEIRDFSTEELQSKVAELKEELFNLRFQLATAQIDNPCRLKDVRKDIARVKTILRERDLGIKRA